MTRQKTLLLLWLNILLFGIMFWPVPTIKWVYYVAGMLYFVTSASYLLFTEPKTFVCKAIFLFVLILLLTQLLWDVLPDENGVIIILGFMARPVLFHLYLYELIHLYETPQEPAYKKIKTIFLSIIGLLTTFMICLGIWAITQKVESDKQKALYQQCTENSRKSVHERKIMELEISKLKLQLEHAEKQGAIDKESLILLKDELTLTREELSIQKEIHQK